MNELGILAQTAHHQLDPQYDDILTRRDPTLHTVSGSLGEQNEWNMYMSRESSVIRNDLIIWLQSLTTSKSIIRVLEVEGLREKKAL